MEAGLSLAKTAVQMDKQEKYTEARVIYMSAVEKLQRASNMMRRDPSVDAETSNFLLKTVADNQTRINWIKNYERRQTQEKRDSTISPPGSQPTSPVLTEQVKSDYKTKSTECRKQRRGTTI